MRSPANRRDFLKMLALLPPGMYLSEFLKGPDRLVQDPEAKNVLVVVFDTLSAKHLSVNGYRRETTPNLARIAQRATVYRNHHAGGNWTTPGTATLLTGTYPWTHRAFSERDFIAQSVETHNIFNAFDRYYRLGYSHNSIVDRFLGQFSVDIEYVKQQKELFITNELAFNRLFPRDNDLASLSWDRIVNPGEKSYTYSLFFSHLYEKYSRRIEAELLKDFPRGIPHTGEDGYFLLEDGIDWLISRLTAPPRPFLGYFHYLPPHRPYNTRREFINAFLDDGVGHHIEKPRHPYFSQASADQPLNLKIQSRQRQLYDEFILYVDAEFGRLYDFMERSGLADDTWIVFTSDHGELFERGIFGHSTPVLYQPVVQIPLLILEPGQRQRRDIHVPTSAVDVLPTLLQVTGNEVPGWLEGQVLPPFTESAPGTDRSIYALEATDSLDDQPLGPATVMMVKGRYKIVYYFGYEELRGIGPYFEAYDLENDPEELNDIFSARPDIFQGLRDELLEKIRVVDEPYRRD